MFHALQPVADHPCCQMQNIVETFFQRAIDQPTFSLGLFPEWLADKPTRSHDAIVEKFRSVHEQIHTKDAAFRTQLHLEVLQANQIEGLCQGAVTLPATVLAGSPELANQMRVLMLSLYESLDNAAFKRSGKNGRPTQQWYREFISKNVYLCPFCGLENYKNAAGRVREQFDHYLSKSKYHWSAVNSANLVPTCNTCNSKGYKGDKDILESGLAFYPFSQPPRIVVTVLLDSLPDATDPQPMAKIRVELACEPNDANNGAKLETWDRVYAVKERLANEVSEHHEDWMREITIDHPELVDHEGFRDLILAARDKARLMAQHRLGAGQTIRAAFFDFLVEQSQSTFFASFLKLHNARVADGTYSDSALDAEAYPPESIPGHHEEQPPPSS